MDSSSKNDIFKNKSNFKKKNGAKSKSKEGRIKEEVKLEIELERIKKELESEKVRNRTLEGKVSELEALLASAYDDIEERDDALIELSQKYEELYNKCGNFVGMKIKEDERDIDV